MEYNENVERLREELRYSTLLLRAIIPLIPKKDKQYSYQWLEKLRRLEGSYQQLKNRCDYTWFYIMNATQGGGMMPPFRHQPPLGELPQLSTILPKELYAEVVDNSEKNNWWKEEGLIKYLNYEGLEEDKQRWNLSPRKFIKNQPKPLQDGIYFYGCVFAPYKDY